jgi:hypothetical protein
MKTLIKLIILLSLFSCDNNYQGYRIENATKSVLNVNADDGFYSIQPHSKIRITTKGIIKKSNLSFEDTELKPILINQLTHPDETFLITAYTHDFEVYVFGNSDSVRISINGKQYYEKLPFFYGDNTTKEYYIISDPTPQGYTYTYVYIKGERKQKIEHYRGALGIISSK